MGIVQAARAYVRENELRTRGVIYSATRFARLVQDCEPQELTTELLATYRKLCVAAKLSPATIEGSVKDLLLLYKTATGQVLDSGRRLKVPRPQPCPASLDSIAAVYAESPAWLRQYLALSYWTCLRVADVLRLQLSRPDPSDDFLRFTASKTGFNHTWPVPAWLKRHLAISVVMPVGQPEHHLKRVLRREIRAAAAAARVTSFTPQQLRQRGLSEWSRANAMSGRLVHGSSLGILDHYVDPMIVLESAAPSVRLPTTFASASERAADDAIPAIVARLDPEARQLVIATAKRLAR